MRAQRGFALIAALWLLVALSVVGLAFGLRAHGRNLAAANALEATRATAAADAGIADAQAMLARPEAWAQLAAVLSDSGGIGGARYWVSFEDANAALNLTQASEEELRRLFIALRLDFGLADRLAQAIMDWQDTDDLHRARGAEREDYLRAGALVLPTNCPFDRLAELRHVAGMTLETYKLVRPHLTLLGTGQVNLNSASLPLLLALPGMTEQSAAVVIRRRTGSRPIRSLEELANELSSAPRAVLQASYAALNARALFETREMIATSEGWTPGSAVQVAIEALFARGGNNSFLVSRSTR